MPATPDRSQYRRLLQAFRQKRPQEALRLLPAFNRLLVALLFLCLSVTGGPGMLAGLALIAFLSPPQAHAANIFFDQNGVSAGTGFSASGSSAPWDTSSLLWVNAGTATTTSGTLAAGSYAFSGADTAFFTGNGGTLSLGTLITLGSITVSTTDSLKLAPGAGSLLLGTNGSFTIGSGGLLSLGAFLDGGSYALTKSGAGILQLSGAAANFSALNVSAGTVAVAAGGSLTVQTGTSVTNVLKVGNGTGTGLLTIAPGASVTTGYLQMGLGNSSSGAVINQGTLVILYSGGNSSGAFDLANNTSGYGYYRHDTQTPVSTSNLSIGGSTGGSGVLDLMTGSLTSSVFLMLARGGVYQNAQLNVFSGSLSLPNNAGSFMYYTASSKGTNVINILPGGVVAGGASSVLELNRSSTVTSGTVATGMVNIKQGALLAVGSIRSTQSAGLKLLNMDGGTLKATNSNSTFVDNLTGFYLYSNGGTIDTSGFNVTIPQSILAPTGYGLASGTIAMAPVGGYIGRPIVLLSSSGTGTGATAMADFNVNTGTIGGIIITNPGYGYAPGEVVTVSFSGGGGSAGSLTLSGGSLVANTSGGLTKVGAGVLVLSGTNTYTGATRVNAGTLALAGPQSISTPNPALWTPSNLSVSAGATLQLNAGGAAEFSVLDVGTLLTTANGILANGASIALDTTNALNGNLIYAGNIGVSSNPGVFGVLKVGAGSFTLAGAGNYSSGITLTAGTLNINHSNALGSGLFTILGGAFDNTTGAPLTLSGSSPQNWSGNIGFNGSNDVDLGSTTTVNLGANTTLFANAKSLTVGGLLDGNSLSFTKSGAGDLILSGTASDLGAFAIAGGTVNVVAGGSLTVLSGTSTVNPLKVGSTTGNGLLTIAPGASVTTGYLQIGLGGASSVGAVVNQGTLKVIGTTTSYQALQMGFSPGGYGYYRHDTPASISMWEIGIGGNAQGHGVMDVMSGTIGAMGLLHFGRASSAGYQNGQLNVFGGSVSMPATTAFFNSSALYGYDAINVFAGGFAVGASNTVVDLNKSGTLTSGTVANGMVNLQQGGILSAQSVKATQSVGFTFLNMDGGTLKATASGTAFVNNLTGFYLYSNGGTIDTSGFNVTIPESILSPTGYGLASGTIAMAPVGGYIGRPIVLLTSIGAGTGASAIADFNVNTGTVGGIIITSPGSGYDPNDTITASFLGGGGSAGSLTLSGGSLVSNTRPNMGGLTKTGAGTLTLSSTNTYSGTTTVSAGMLQFTTRTALNNGSVAASNIAVQSGAVLGLNIGGPNDFTVADLDLLLAGSSSVFANSSTLALDTSNVIGEAVYSGTIANSKNGTFSLRKLGSGSLTLSGNNTYSGGIGVWNGTLNIANASAVGTGLLTIAGGAIDNTSGAPKTLLNNNPQTWNGSFVFNGSSDLNLGTGPVTLGLSSTVTVNASTLSVGGGVGGAYNFSKAGPGTLVFNGANNFNATTTVHGGTLVLGGSLTSTGGLKIGNGVVQMLPEASMVQPSISVGSASGVQAAMFVSGGVASASAWAANNPLGIGDLGFGYFELSGGSVSFYRANISANPSSLPGVGVLMLTGGTLVAQDMMLARSGTSSAASGMFTVTGGSFVHSGGIFSIGYGHNAAGLAITGTALLNVQGGNLETSGQIYMGTSTATLSPFAGEAYLNLNGGILRSGNINFGTSGSQYVNFNGGTLRANSSSSNLIPANSVNGSMTVYKNGATVDSNGFNITIPANLAAPTGSGFSGGTITNAGTGYTGAPFISVSGSGGFGASAYATVNNGMIASIVVSSPGSNYTGPLTLTVTGGGGSGFAYTPTLATNIGGGLTKTGAGTLTLSGTNGYSGTTTVSAGMLQFAKRVSLYNAGTSQWTASNIVVNSGATFAVNLGGTGEFSVNDIPLLVGGTNSGGFLSGSTFGIDMSNASGGSLYAGVIANPNGGLNTLGLQKWGPASLTLSGANTYTGGTTLTSGSLMLSGGSNRLSSAGAITVQGGVLDLGGNSQSSSGAFTLTLGTLQNGTLIGTGTAFGLQSGSIFASLGGSAGLNKTGAGTVVLGAPNTSTGDVRIDGGILQIGLGGVSGSLSPLGSITNNGTLVFKRSDSLTQGVDFGTISGSGSLTQLGSGSLVMTSSNTYTGTTTISAGTLMLGTGGTNGLLSATSSIVNNGLLILNRSDVLSQGSNFASNISGNGGVLQLGGALVLSGTILSTTGSLMIGNATATLVAGGSIREGTVQIGAGQGTVGALTINGGSLTVQATLGVNNYAHLSVGDGGFGYLEINGGTLTSTTSRFAVAASTSTTWTSPVTGVVYMTNGSVSFPDLCLGRTGTSGGTVNSILTIVGGTMAVSGAGQFFQLGMQGNGIAALNIQGGLVDHSFGKVTMGSTNVFLGQSFLNLNGGVLKTGSFMFSNSVSASYISLNGGTLQAGAQGATLIPAMSSGGGGVFANPGGAIIDTNGFDVTVSGALLAPTGNGVAAASLTGAGSGYTGAPLVQISGGGGGGASGYATVSNGTLSSVVITSAGTGYTSAPTLTLTGGGGPDATLSTTIAPNVSGGLTKNGSGTLALTGANTFTGVTTIMNGILQIGTGGAAGSITSSSNVRNYGSLVFNLSSTTSQSNITGTGSVRQVGSGVTILGGTNSYSGTTSIESGTLQFSTPSAFYGADTTRWNASNISVSSGATFALNVGGTGFAEDDVNSVLSMGSAGGVFANGATLAFDTTNATGGAFGISSTISDFSGNALAVSKLGQGILTLSGANTFSGMMTIRAGTIEVRGGVALPDTAIVNLKGGQLLVSESETIGVIQGTTSGTINLGDGVVLTVGVPGSSTTLPALITGGGSLVVASGSLSLSAANTFTGDMTIGNGGTLNVTNNTNLDGGVLKPANARTYTISTGGVLQVSASLNLGGSLAGTTVTGGGVLQLNSGGTNLLPLGSAGNVLNLSLNAGAVIEVMSGIARNNGVLWTNNLASLHIGPAGIFYPYSSVNTVLVDALTGSGTLSGNGTAATANAVIFGVNNGSGTFSGLISNYISQMIKSGTGTQVFAGSNTYTGATQIWNGTLSVSSINSVSTGSMLSSSFGAPTTSGTGTIALGTLTTTGQLLYTGTGETTDRIVNLLGVTGGGILDHSGTGLLKFTGLSGSGSFTSTGAGSKTLTLQGSSSGMGEISAVIVNNSSLNTTAVLKQGSGKWILSGTNTYTGGTTLSEGSLFLSSGSNRLSTTSPILIAGGTLDLGGYSQRTSGTITFAGGVSQNGTLISTGTAFNALGGTVQSILAGTQGLVKTTAGTFTLRGINTYTGATTLTAGSLFLTGGSNRLATTGSLNLSGGVLDLGGNFQTTSGTITISGATVQNGVLTSTGAAFVAQGGVISAILAGTLGLLKSTSATLTLTGANTYTGATTVTSGVLTVSNAGSLSPLTSLSVSNNAQFNYLPSASGTLTLSAGTLSSGSSLGVNFGSTILFTGAVSMGGTVNLNPSGSYTNGVTYTLLQAANGLNAGTYNVTGANDYEYTLGLTPTAVTITPTYIGPLKEAYWKGGQPGAPSAWGVSNWSLTSGGPLQSRNPGAASSVILDGNGTNLAAMTLGSNVSVGSITTASSFSAGTLGYTSGLLLNLGSSDARGVVTANAGTLTIQSDILLVSDSTFTNNSAGTLTFGGIIGGTSALVKSGSGTVLFSGANIYSGTTTITEGVLQIGAGGSSGGLPPNGVIINNGTLVFNRSDVFTQGVDFGTVLSGTGSLVKLGSGTMVLTTASTYTWSTNVLEGVLNVRHANGLGSSVGATNVAAGAALEMQGGISIASESLVLSGTGIGNGGALRNISGSNTLGGAITLSASTRINADSGTLVLNGTVGSNGGSLTVGGSGGMTLGGAVNLGAGGVTKDGAGSVYLGGTGNYSGTTRISAGTLQVGTGGTTGGLLPSSAILNNALLVFSRSNTATQGADFGMLISGSGSLQKSGTGTLILNGTNTYSGSTMIEQGTLTIAQTGSLPSGGSLIFGAYSSTSAGRLDLSTASATVANLLVQTSTSTANLVIIGAGQSLTVAGGSFFTVGVNNGAATTTTKLVFSGAGSLNVTMPSGTLSVGRVTSANTNTGTLDLTALGTFNLDASELRVGVNKTPLGYLYLSNTANSIAVSKIAVGDGEGSGINTTASKFTLGQGTNVIAADNIFVGVTKDSGAFSFQYQTAGTLGTASIGGKTQPFVNIYAGTQGTGTATSVTGDVDFRGHAVSVTAGTVMLGLGPQSASTGGAFGYLSMDAGSFSVNTLSMGLSVSSGTVIVTNAGTLNIGGGTFTVAVGGSLLLASSPISTNTVRAAINLTGGSLVSNADIVVGGGTNALATLALLGGTLDLTGHNLGSLATAGSLALNIQAGRLQNMGLISGTAGITKTTAGVLTLAGTNTFTGGVLLSAGTLNLNSAGALGAGSLSIAATTSLNNTSGAALTLAHNNSQLWNGDFTFAGSNPLNMGAGTVSMGTSTAITVTSSTLTLAGAINGDGLTLSKAGLGTLVLAGTTSVSSVILTAGSLVAGASSPFGSSLIQVTNGNLDLRGFAVSASSLTMSGGVLSLALGNGLSLSGAARLAGTIEVSGNPASLGSARYSVASAAGGWSGSFNEGALPDNLNYHLQINGPSLDLQHRATVSLSPTLASQSVHTGSTAISVAVGNTAPVNSDTLYYALSGAMAGSGYTLAAGSSTTLTGNYLAVPGINSLSVSAISSGSIATSNGTQNTTFTVTGYSLAAASASQTVDFGTFRTGTQPWKAFSISNLAPVSALYSEALSTNGFSGTSSSLVASGSSIAVAGGSSANGTLRLQLAAGVGVGEFAGTTTLGLVSNAVSGSGLSDTALASQTIHVTGSMYDYANPLYSGGTIAFGNMRVGGAAAIRNVAFANATVSNAAYQDALDVSATTNNSKVSALGFLGLLAGAGTASLTVSGTTTAAGDLGSTLSLLLVSNTNGVSGLSRSTLAAPSTIVTTGGVYDYANPVYTGGTIAFGNVRVGGTLALQNVGFTNAVVSNASYQDSLDVSATSNNTRVSAVGFAGLLAGAGTGFLQVSGTTATAGALASTLALGLGSNTNGVSGLSNSTVAAASTITTSGGVFDYANPVYAGGTFDFGNVRVNGALSSRSIVFTNLALTNAAYQDALDVSATTNNAKVSATGFSMLAAGTGSAALILSGTTTSAGNFYSTLSLSLVSNASGVAGLSNKSLSPLSTIATKGGVYDFANPVYSGGTIDLGNVRVGGTVTPRGVVFTNGVVSDAAYQDALDASATSDNPRLAMAGFSGLLAGGGTASLMVSGTTTSAGNLASTLSLLLVSNTNGVAGLSGSTIAAPSVLRTRGGVYDYAKPVYAGGTLDFGNVREGAVLTPRSVTFTNAVISSGSYQDSLDVSAASDNAMVSATGFTALAAGTGHAALVLNAATGSPGSLNSTLALTLTSNANGVAGLSAQSLTTGSGLATTGGVYAYAKPTYSTGTIAFGNVHVGDSRSVIVSNPSIAAAFQDALDLSLSLPEGITSFSGKQIISAGSSLSVLFTAHAGGVLSGSAVVSQTSNASGVAGLSNGTLGAKMLPISGTAYALAEGRVGAASLGNFHVGVAKNIALFNTAPAGSFSEDLGATLAAVSNTLVAGSVAHLIAGAANGSSLSVTLVSAGTGSFRLELESTATVNGASIAGLSPTALAPQILSITQNAVAYNVASVSSAQAVDLGNVRRGEPVTVPLSLTNTAPVSAYYTETLSSTGFSNTSNGILAGGSVSGIEGGTSGTGSLFVGFSNGLAAGVQSGTTMLGVRSNAVIGSGLSDTALAPQKVTVSGVVYDYANPVFNGGTIAFGNLRVGEALASRSVTFTNAVVSSALYQDALDVSANANNAKVSAAGFTGLLAGSGTASLIVAGTTATAGNLGSMLALLLVSNTNGVSGLTGSTLAVPSAISTSGGVYDYANPVYAGGTLDFGNVRVGSAPTTKGVTFSNTVIHSAAYQDSLDVSGSSSNPRVVATGFTGLAAGGGTQSLSVSIDTGSAGGLASALSLSLTSNARGLAGLSNSTLNPTAVITSTGSVFAYAQPSWSCNSIAFGNVHVGTVRAVSVTNSVVAPSGYQDSLEVTGVGTDKVSFTSGTFKVTAGASRNLTLTAFAPGLLTGSVSISQRSHANGVDGLLDGPLSTVNLGVTGAAYALASGSVDGVGLGNFHVGVQKAVALKNTAAPGLFSEDLSATLSSISNTIVSGSVNALVAGAIDNSHLLVTLTGPGSGSVRLNLESTGSVRGVSNGLGKTVLGSQTLNLSAAGYALAATNFEDTMLDLGAIRQNESFGFRPIAITNTLSAGVYNEKLRASFVGGQGVSTRGGTAVISAGSTASGVLSVGLAGSTAGAGTLAGTVQVQFSSQEVNQSGLGNTPLPDATRTISVSGNIYRLASGSLNQRVELGVIREGGSFTSKAVTVRNTAANDGFSDDLKAVFIATSSSAVKTSGIVSRLGAGFTSDALRVGFNVGQTKAGLITGTASVGYTSLGRAGTGLADAPTALSRQDVTFGGKIYRLATGSLNAETLDFGAVRAASGTSTATLVVRNTAAGDGFSDLLGVIASTGGAFKVATGSLLIGGTSNGSVVVSYAPGGSSAGLVNGTLSVAMRSVGQSDTNYADVSVGTQTVGIRATVFRPAVGELRQSGTLLVSGGTVSLAPVRVGVAFAPLSLDVLNTASRADAYSESLNVGTAIASGFAVSSGSAYLVAAGTEKTAALRVGLNTSATGTTGMKTGGLTWSFETDGKGTSGLGKAVTGTMALNISGQVYDGKGVWNSGSGAWSDWIKWTVSGGRPGMDNGASVVSGDTARIDSGAGPISVSLPGGTLNLAGISLRGSGGVSLGGVGTIALAGTMGASSGAHSVSADVVLIKPSTFVVEQGAKLTIGGLVSGGTLTKQGAGTLQLAAGYRSMESASVESGLLMLGNGTSVPEIGDSQASVAGGRVRTIYLGLGAELAFNVSRNLSLVNLEIIGPGAANVSSVNPNFVVNWKNGLSEEDVEAGGVVDLSALFKKTNLKVSDAMFTLGATSKELSNAVTVSGSLGVSVAGSVTFSGVIGGTGALVKENTGVVTLAGSNSFAGGTRVNAGTLIIQNNSALGTGAVTLAPPARVVLDLMGSGTVSNALMGAGSVVKSGSGTVTLSSANNSYSGGTTVSAGTLNIFSSAALGTGGLVLSGGVLNLGLPLNITAPMALSGQSGLVSTMGPSTLSGALSGVGTLRLTGALTGATNVASGAVTISGGTLNSLVKSGTGALVIEGNTELKGTAVVSSGSVTVSSAAQTLAGVTTLVVGNKGSSGAVLNVGANGATLSSGQTLKGIGTVSGVMKLTAGSKLSPGNSIGTQSIEGRLEVGPGVVYDPEFKVVGGALLSDLYTVIGAGTDRDGNVTAGSILLTGGIVTPVGEINRSDFTDFVPHKTPILSSTIGAVISGTFDGLVSSSSSVVMRLRLEYVNGRKVTQAEDASGAATLSDEVRLVIQRVPYRRIGAVGNRAEVGDGLNVSLATKDPLLLNLLDILDIAQSEGEVIRVLDQLNPKVFAEVYSLALSRLQDVQKTVSDRLTQLGTALTTMGEAEVLSLATGQGSEWTAWTNAYGSWSAREANARLGEGGSSRSSAGNLTGVERRFGALTLGLLGALGTSSTQMNQPEASMASESWHLGLYMSAPLTGRVFVDGSFVFGEGENVLKRTQTVPITDEYGTLSTLSLAGRTRLMNQEWLVQLGVGAQLAPAGSRWSLVPTLRAAYAGVRQQGARESGAGSLGIESDSKWNGTVLTRTGMDVAREGRLGSVPVRATGTAAWVHDFAADPRRLGVQWQGADAAPWTVSSARRSADVLRLGLSLELGLGDRRTLRLYGEQEYLQNMKVVRGGVTFTIGF